MINLLPLQEKNNVNIEYRARLITVALFFVFALIILSMVLRISLYIALSAKERVAQEHLATIISNDESEFPIDFLEDANKKLSILQADDIQSVLHEDVFRAIVEERAEILITSISYQKSNEDQTVRVSGVSSSREELLDFVKALERKGFSDVDVPVSSFVKVRDLEFSLNIKI
ncbi:hypothetical protein ACFLY0_02195 [Patescibacteria group bacterium]